MEEVEKLLVGTWLTLHMQLYKFTTFRASAPADDAKRVLMLGDTPWRRPA